MSGIAIEILDRQGGGCYYGELLPGILEIGRQGPEDVRSGTKLFESLRVASGAHRVNIAPAKEVTVSRNQLSLELLPGSKVRACRKLNGVPIELNKSSWTSDEPKSLTRTSLISLSNGRFEIRVHFGAASLNSLDQPTMAPGRAIGLTTTALNAPAEIEPETLAQWFQEITSTLESATTSEEFQLNASRAMVEILRLDSGRVMLRTGAQWKPAAEVFAPGIDGSHATPSARILSRVAAEKQTFWEVPTALKNDSLEGVQAIVAAPILDRNDKVIGALYGDRRLRSGRESGITRLQAMLVRMLACGVAAGMARLEQQKAAMQAQVRFEQFFTRDLANHLATDPDLLTGREAEVTLLFSDIRGFSRISSRVQSAKLLVEWLGEVMTALSDCVIAEEGVLVDYIGDEIVAMWGAPAEDPQHAMRACQAGKMMIERISEVSARWQTRIGEPTAVGVGINSGPAFVGNIGTSRKFKYGALGSTVNVASRVQGATKYFGCQMMVTAATRKRLSADFATRRLRLVNAINISEPLELHEVIFDPSDSQNRLRLEYEAALDAFEAGRFHRCLGALGTILDDFPNDAPSRLLLAHASAAAANPATPPGRSWELPSK